MTTQEARPGRPRDPGRDAAILDATLELLGEVGYDKLTVRTIAQRAGAGLATIYRRWQTKEELVVDAITRFQDEFPDSQSDTDPVANMVDLIMGFAEILQGDRRGLIPGMISQLPSNTSLADALRARAIWPRLSIVADQLRRVPGVDADRVVGAAELIPASLFFQIIMLGRRLDKDDVRQAVDNAIRVAS